MRERRLSRSTPVQAGHQFTIDGGVFPGRELLGRPTILVLLRYLG